MPLFEPSPAELAAAQPMIEWLNTAPPAEVAAEVMAAFGPGAAIRQRIAQRTGL